MNNILSHRGPDGEGLKIINNVGLAHKRLSIIDINSGAQPLSNETNEIWITFNGEIYNYISLRELLISKGHIFKTNSDTEVIVHLYEEHGIDCLTKLDGMFAFALFDTEQNKLFLARDRMGQKPLNYYFKDNIFAFSSELQSIVKHPAIKRVARLQSIHDYLSLQYIPAPDTVYQDVYKLLPAHYLELNLNSRKMVINKYWQCSFAEKQNISYEDAVGHLRALVRDSVSKRLMSEVPLGVFLSGGIDSTIIAANLAELKGEQIQTFTIGFADKKFDERHFARMASEKFGTLHHEKVVDPSNFDILPELVSHYGEPYSDASMLPTYYLSKFTRERITVALSGDGADEIFAGYYRYLVLKKLSCLDIIPYKIRNLIYNLTGKVLPSGAGERVFAGKLNRILRAFASKPDKRYQDIINRCDETLKHSIYGDRFKDNDFISTDNFISNLIDTSTSADLIERVIEADIQSYLCGDILTKIDIASMASSLEVRSPFMDHRIVEFAASIPLKYKQGFYSRKRILTDAFKNEIPDSLLRRSKMGFGVPVANWLRGKWKNVSTDLLINGNLIKDDFIDRTAVTNILWEHQFYKKDHSYLIWSLIVFELWYNQFMI